MHATIQGYVAAAAQHYFCQCNKEVLALPLPRTDGEPTGSLVEVPLAPWCSDLGPAAPRTIPVDSSCLVAGEGPPWQRCDWWRAAFLMLTGAAERAHEQRHGPIHSYRFRLPRGLWPMFERPWVNWICLMLARWATGRPPPIPRPRFDLTHDVDAVSKALPTRVKQTAFSGINAIRLATRGRPGSAFARLGEAARFGLLPGDYWQFPAIMALEAAHGVTSTFHFYGGRGGWRRSPKRVLMDPFYDVSAPRLAALMRELIDQGWHVGLHQAFDSWRSADAMRREAAGVAAAARTAVTRCRQHWLRFSWAETWAAQEAAGLRLDTTLGFNDTPGFRNGAALEILPWNGEAQAPRTLRVLPLVLMDSHLFDYGLQDGDRRQETIDHWLAEVSAVGGEASVVWHQRVFHADYGWGDAYRHVLRHASAG